MANRQRDKEIHFMTTEEERDIIKERAREVNMNLGEYARRMLIEGQVTVVDLAPIKELSGELGRIGNNINQIARKANQTNEITVDELHEVQLALGEIWRLQKSTLLKLQ